MHQYEAHDAGCTKWLARHNRRSKLVVTDDRWTRWSIERPCRPHAAQHKLLFSHAQPPHHQGSAPLRPLCQPLTAHALRPEGPHHLHLNTKQRRDDTNVTTSKQSVNDACTVPPVLASDSTFSSHGRVRSPMATGGVRLCTLHTQTPAPDAQVRFSNGCLGAQPNARLQ